MSVESPIRSIVRWSALAIGVLCLASAVGVHASTDRLITGKKITPAGVNQEIGNLPMNMILSPNGKFDVPDSAPAAKLNLILWKSVKGPDSKMPAVRHTLGEVKED